MGLIYDLIDHFALLVLVVPPYTLKECPHSGVCKKLVLLRFWDSQELGNQLESPVVLKQLEVVLVSWAVWFIGILVLEDLTFKKILRHLSDENLPRFIPVHLLAFRDGVSVKKHPLKKLLKRAI